MDNDVIISVAGVTMENRQHVLRSIYGRCNVCREYPRVRLTPEPNNPYDANAVSIDVLSLNKKWYTIGYVPKDDSVYVVDIIKMGIDTHAYIDEVGVFERDNKAIYYCKVRIRLG